MASAAYRFGPFVVDRAAYRVFEDGRPLDLTPKLLDLLQDLANALRVRYAVVGSYQRNGERVRITARVLDVASGEALADAKVDGRLADIFELQDEVSAQFARERGAAARGAAPLCLCVSVSGGRV